jgi:hypothetical protein
MACTHPPTQRAHEHHAHKSVVSHEGPYSRRRKAVEINASSTSGASRRSRQPQHQCCTHAPGVSSASEVSASLVRIEIHHVSPPGTAMRTRAMLPGATLAADAEDRGRELARPKSRTCTAGSQPARRREWAAGARHRSKAQQKQHQQQQQAVGRKGGGAVGVPYMVARLAQRVHKDSRCRQSACFVCSGAHGKAQELVSSYGPRSVCGCSASSDATYLTQTGARRGSA